MIIKMILVLAMIGLFIGGVYNHYDNDIELDNKKIYHGPIPIGYSLEHFRNTGETIREVFS